MMTTFPPTQGPDASPEGGDDFSADELAAMLQAFSQPENTGDPNLPAAQHNAAGASNGVPPAATPTTTVPRPSDTQLPPSPRSAALEAFNARYPNSVQSTKPSPVVISSTPTRVPSTPPSNNTATAANSHTESEVNSAAAQAAREAEHKRVLSQQLRQQVATAQETLAAQLAQQPVAPVKPSRFELKWEKALRQARSDLKTLCERIAQLGEAADARSVSILQPFAHAKVKRVRFETAKALRNVGTPQATRLLLSLLKDPKPEVARAAMIGLARHVDQTTLPCVLAYGIQDASTRASVAGEFAKLQDRENTGRQLFEYAQSEDSESALLALQLAARAGDDQVVGRIGPFTRHHNAEFRRVAIDCLIKTDDRQVVRFLNTALKDTDDQVRARAATGLSKWNSENSAGRLLKLLRDPSVAVRRNAAAAIRRIAKPEFANEIAELLETETDPATILSLIEAVGQTGSKEAAKKVYPFTRRPEPEVRITALSALVRVNDRRAMPALIRMLNDDSKNIRQKAIAGLAHKGNDGALNQLEVILAEDRDPEIRSAAARAIGKIASPGSLDSLQTAVQDESTVRCQAVIALGQIGGKKVVPILIDRLHDTAPDVRYNAAKALGAAKNRDSIPALRKLIEDPDEMVRRTVCKSLTDMGVSVSADLRRKRFATLSRKIRSAVPSWQVAVTVVGVLLATGTAAWFFAPGALGISSEPPLLVKNVLQIEVSPNGKHIAILRERGVVDLWPAAEGEMVARFDDVQIPTGIFFTPKSNSLLLLGNGGERRWDLKQENSPTAGSQKYQSIQRVAASNPDRTIVITTNQSGAKALIWNAKQEPSPLNLPAAFLRVMAVSPDGSQVVGVSKKNEFAISSVADGEMLSEFRIQFPTNPRASVTSVTYSPDGSQIAVGLNHGEIAIIDLESGGMQSPVSEGEAVQRIQWAADGQIVAAHSSGLTFISESGEVSSLIDIPVKDIKLLAMTPDGTTIAVAGAESRDAAIIDGSTKSVRYAIKITNK